MVCATAHVELPSFDELHTSGGFWEFIIIFKVVYIPNPIRIISKKAEAPPQG